MTGKERILAALERKQPDVVPIWELAFNESSIIDIASNFMDADKLPPRKLFFDMDDMELMQLIDALITMGRELDLDGANTFFGGPMERLNEQQVRNGDGVIYQCTDHGEPYPVAGPISSMSDLKSFKIRAPRDEDFVQTMLARANFPDKAISYMLSGPFYVSWCLRGSMEALLMDYALNPELAHALARVATDWDLAVVEKVAAKGADFCVFECDLAFVTNTLMSKGMYEDFIGPYHKEIVARIHELGMKAVKHSDGVLTPFIPYFVEEGFDGLHPIQPQCMDIGKIKKEFGSPDGSLCIMGNIDCSELLPYGTPDEVRESVKQTISVAAPGGGYIISSSNTIHPDCRAENYLAMVKAAREFGKYPELAG